MSMFKEIRDHSLVGQMLGRNKSSKASSKKKAVQPKQGQGDQPLAGSGRGLMSARRSRRVVR